ncbi:MAG TPA: hypothetical protein VKB51_08525 [bacterium]|nr:hypothetical protein [bacterium]
MEHQSQERTDDQREQLPKEAGAMTGEKDVRIEMMNRDKRHEALAWAEAYKLIRGGVDEVVEFIEGSQYTIELLLETLRDAACRCRDVNPPRDPAGCEFCQRRDELLSQLA